MINDLVEIVLEMDDDEEKKQVTIMHDHACPLRDGYM